MGSTRRRVGSSRGEWRVAAGAAPRLAFGALRHGMLPAGLSLAHTARREGLSDLHWKTLGDALVRFLQNAGPVFTKFGQVLATRTDLLPAALCARLEALYTRQPPMTRRELESVLRAAYGEPLPFHAFRWRPIAVGSVGQVHRARLARGKKAHRILVKILRPGIATRIERDLEVARALLALFPAPARRRGRGPRTYLRRALDDLAESYARETDLREEAAALREFGRRFRNHPRVVVPACYAEFSSSEVLVMEELRGEPLSAVRRRVRRNPRRARDVADLALREILEQIFADGRFHADPHAGNLLLLPDGRLGLIDLGATGELTRADRRSLARAARAFVARDVDRLIRALLELGSAPPDLDRAALERDVRTLAEGRKGEILARLRGRGAGRAPAESNPLEAFATDLFRVLHEHEVLVPASTTLFLKTLITIEGVARSLDPELDLVARALPVVLQSLAPRWMRWVLGARPRPIGPA